MNCVLHQQCFQPEFYRQRQIPYHLEAGMCRVFRSSALKNSSLPMPIDCLLGIRPSGAVTKYEARIPNIRLYTSAFQTGVSTVAPYSPAEQQAVIGGLCGTIQQLCTGPNTQYNSTATCENTLAHKAFGDYDNTWADSVTCREIHILLARIRPSVSAVLSPSTRISS